MLQFLLGWEDVYIAKATQVFENAVVFAVESETGIGLFFDVTLSQLKAGFF